MRRRSATRLRVVAAALVLALAGAGTGALVASADPTPHPSPTPGPTTPSTTTGTTPSPSATPSPSPGPAPTVPTDTGSAAADPNRPTQGTGLYEQLGGNSPLCTDTPLGDVGSTASQNCRQSGAIANAYPSDNYGIDNNVDTSVTSPSSWIASTVQWLMQIIWLGLVYLVKGVLSMLEWAFSADLYDASQKESAAGVASMYRVVGAPWMTFALAVAGMWGLWQGLVRRRAIETLGGLAAAVGLMLVALVIISRPSDTVGHLSQISNQAAVSALSAASAATVDKPAENLAEAERNMFDAIVLRPWCALEFGDVKYCTDPHDGTTVADVWLSFTPDSKARQMLYKRTKDGGDGTSWTDELKTAVSAGWSFITGRPSDAVKKEAEWQALQDKVAGKADKVITKSPQNVQLQEGGGTMRRFAVLLVVGIGVVGACALIGSIAIRLLIQGGFMTLVLLLLAPLALLAPAFGEGGRRVFVGWGRKLLSAIFSKFIYAVLLAVVILVTNVLAGLQQALGGWLPCWIVESTFWWSLFLRRRELLAMISMDSGRPSSGLSHIYHLTQISRDMRRTASGLTVRPLRAAFRPLRRNAYAFSRGEESFAREYARDFASRRAREALAVDHATQYAAATERLDEAATDRARQGEVRQRIGAIDRQMEGRGTRLDVAQRRRLEDERERLAAENRDIERRMNSAEMARARSVAARGPEPPALDDRDVERWVTQRRWEVEHRPWNHESNLRAAGIDPAAHRQSEAAAATDPAARAIVERNRLRAEEQQRRDRVLLTAARADRDAPPLSRADRRTAVRHIVDERDRERADARAAGQPRPTHAQDLIDRHQEAERRRIRLERRRARVYR